MNNAQCYTSSTTRKYQSDESFSIEDCKQQRFDKSYQIINNDIKSKSFFLWKQQYEKNQMQFKSLNDKKQKSFKKITMVKNNKHAKVQIQKKQSKSVHNVKNITFKHKKKNNTRFISHQVSTNKDNQNNDVIKDYILLNNNIYAVEDPSIVMDEVINRGKDLFSYGKYYTFVSHNLEKVQKYFKTFLHKKPKQPMIDIKQLNQMQKVSLYKLLKQQISQQNKLIQKNENILQRQDCNQLTQQLQNVFEQMQNKIQHLSKNYPEKQSQISKWQNRKLHQLMFARSLLSKQIQSQIKQILTCQPHQILERQLQQLNREQHHFNKLKRDKNNLVIGLKKHLQLEIYPKNNIQRQLQEDNQPNDQNCFGLAGFLWYLTTLKEFIQNNYEQYAYILKRMKQAYGYSQNQKLYLIRSSQQSWWDIISELEEFKQPILPDTLYIQFEKQVVGIGETQDECLQRENIHIYNKLLLDCMNGQLAKYLYAYPYGQTMPYIQNSTITQYQIGQQNFEYVWDKCISILYSYVVLEVGKQQISMNYQYQYANESYFERNKAKKLVNIQIKQSYEKYFSMYFICLSKVYENIICSIEEELCHQFIYEIMTFN